MTRHLSLFEGFGVELEYMIVDARTLDVMPRSDEILKAASGRYIDEVELGELAWSNELVLHVIELKTNGPKPDLPRLAGRFQSHVDRINGILAPLGGRLLPTAIHPWMNPKVETRLWPHDYSVIYETYDRIFGCSGHGWANIQSAHLNLPFADDEEFGRLHAAIRLLLPIMPALAASSPLVESRLTGLLDSRLELYRSNQRTMVEITGEIIPEPVYTMSAYRSGILEPMYAAVAPFDADGVIQHEWLNSRGAIARFDRNTIEVRVLDMQECCQADIAILCLISACLKAMIDERWAGSDRQKAWPVRPLEEIFLRAIREAENAVVDDLDYLSMFGVSAPRSAGGLWKGIRDGLAPAYPELLDPVALQLDMILGKGTLATRMIRALNGSIERRDLERVYRSLAECLADGEMFGDAL